MGDGKRKTMIFRLTFPIKAAVRMTQRGKFSSPQAREYLANRELIQLTIINQMTVHGFEMLPARTPLRLAIRMVVTKNLHTKDSDNLIKSLADAMKGIVYPDDRWIDRHGFERQLGEADLTVVQIDTLPGTSSGAPKGVASRTDLP
jgi:Holliday junction resolvase RusA-like endonuclease